MSARDPAEKYTEPGLRERLKAEVTAGDRGGRPGQWSARKAQLLAHEYEAHGGGYVGGKDADQQHLSQWTEEDWQTSDGSTARTGTESGGGGASRRYLPREAWERLSPEERREADRTKAAGSRAGHQHAANPHAAREAGWGARQHGEEPFGGYDDLTAADVVHRLGDLDEGALGRVAQHERAGKARKTVLQAVERARRRDR